MKELKSRCRSCTYRYTRRKCCGCFEFDLYEWRFLRPAMFTVMMVVGVAAAVVVTYEAEAGTSLVPSMDDEGNDAGALFINNKDLPVIPVI